MLVVFFYLSVFFFFFSSRRRHTRYWRDWSSDVCSSDLFSRRKVDERDFAVGLGQGEKLLVGTDANGRHRGGGRGEKRARSRHGKHTNQKIGRASCRERVENTGAAGDLKKNKRTERANSD